MSLGFYDGNPARGGKLFDVREIAFWFEVLWEMLNSRKGVAHSR